MSARQTLLLEFVTSLLFLPLSYLAGLLTTVHLRFQYATKSHLIVTQLFNRHFFAIKSAPAIQHVVDNCEQCNSVKKIPHELISQSSTPTASKPGEIFYADVLRRTRQHILVTRDVHSSFSIATIVQGETSSSLRNGLLISTCNIRTAYSTVRVDNAPGFLHLKEDPTLKKHGISLEFGRIKNKNANSVIEKGIQELEHEILNVNPSRGLLTNVQLLFVVETLNARIRKRGLSAREIFYQRDQHANKQL